MTIGVFPHPPQPANTLPMTLHSTHPSIADLRHRARKRIPHFVWEYLDSATGDEATKHRNRSALDDILLRPSVLHGEFTADLSTPLMGAAPTPCLRHYAGGNVGADLVGGETGISTYGQA